MSFLPHFTRCLNLVLPFHLVYRLSASRILDARCYMLYAGYQDRAPHLAIKPIESSWAVLETAHPDQGHISHLHCAFFANTRPWRALDTNKRRSPHLFLLQAAHSCDKTPSLVACTRIHVVCCILFQPVHSFQHLPYILCAPSSFLARAPPQQTRKITKYETHTCVDHHANSHTHLLAR